MDDLDRLIDEAARRMAQHEPSKALSRAVMDRVAARPRRFVRRGLMWGTAAWAVAIAAVVMIVSADRTAPSARVPLEAQGSGLTAQGSELTVQDAVHGSGLKAHGSGTERSSGVAVVASREPASTDEIEPIDDPIMIETISPPPIEVERLDVTLTRTIDPIEIGPIEILPISASND
jgi:hypothetical protein